MPKFFELFKSSKKKPSPQSELTPSASFLDDSIAVESVESEVCTPLPLKKKLMLTDRDLSRCQNIKAMGGTHNVKRYRLPDSSYVICKDIPIWIPRGEETVQNEIFAYEFSNTLNLGLVPETTTPQGNNRRVISRYIKSRTPTERFSRPNDKIFLFDYLLNTGDRNNTDNHNVIEGADGNNYAIDNESILGTAVAGNFIEKEDVKPEHIDLFFKGDRTKTNFMATDWDAFFNKHAPNRAPETKMEFLNRIEFVKQWVSNR